MMTTASSPDGAGPHAAASDPEGGMTGPPVPGAGAAGVLIALLWIQLFLALVPTWRHAEYYGYGWFVPFLAAGLAWRRWRSAGPPTAPSSSTTRRLPLVSVLLLAAAVLIVPLRAIGIADPGWRPPLLLHAAFVCVVTHGLLWHTHGTRRSLAMLPVTVFALSAVPYPWRVEQDLIRSLTGKVIAVTRECFLLTGVPVETQGERLVLGGEMVEVTDGCSGIRSLQSLVMVALFFGELFLLSAWRRMGLVILAGLGAVLTNTLRAWWLARTHFQQGPEAAAAAHDGVGHVAFALGAALLWLSAWVLIHRGVGKRRLVVRKSEASVS